LLGLLYSVDAVQIQKASVTWASGQPMTAMHDDVADCLRPWSHVIQNICKTSDRSLKEKVITKGM